MDNELNDAKEAVLRFASAWTRWELLMSKMGDESIDDPAMKEARSKLIQEHCTPKKRAYVDDSMSFSEPPTYGAVVEANLIHTELATPTKAFVDCQSPLTIHRFVVVKKGGVWKVDSIKWKCSPEANWTNGLIGGP